MTNEHHCDLCLQAETSYIDFNTVVVGSKDEKKLVIYNHSDCSLHYTLLVDENIEGAYPDDLSDYGPPGKL